MIAKIHGIRYVVKEQSLNNMVRIVLVSLPTADAYPDL
jgi:hypothetical protein